MSDFEQRIHPATSRRRRDWRSQGRVPTSSQLGSAVGLLAAVMGLEWMGPELFRGMQSLLSAGFRSEFPEQVDAQWATEQLRTAGTAGFALIVPVVAAVWCIALTQGLLQTRFLLAWNSLRPDFGRLNPLAGLKRMYPTGGLLRSLAVLCRIACLVGIAGAFVSPALFRHVSRAASGGTAELASELGGLLLVLAFRLALCAVVLGLADFLWQVWQYERSIRMTTQELHDELKQTEANPQSRRRQRELLNSRG